VKEILLETLHCLLIDHVSGNRYIILTWDRSFAVAAEEPLSFSGKKKQQNNTKIYQEAYNQ